MVMRVAGCEAPVRRVLFHRASCTSTILAAAAPTPGRVCAVSIRREPACDRRQRPCDRCRRDPHDGDRRACRSLRGMCAVVCEPRLRGIRALLRRRRQHRPVCARGGHRLACARRQRELDRSRAGGICRPARSRVERPYSQAVVERAARLTADVCARYGIPLRRLRAADLVAGKRGVTGHADVSAAFHKSDHWDPGPDFPWTRFLRLARGGNVVERATQA